MHQAIEYAVGNRGIADLLMPACNRYRAIDSAGNTIEFLLSRRRDFIAPRAFLQLAVGQAGRIQPRVIDVDGHPAYPAAIEDLEAVRRTEPALPLSSLTLGQ